MVHQRATVLWWAATERLIRQTDYYFVGRVPDELRPLGEVAAMHESDGIRASRWWTLAELDATDESIYPDGLADLVRSAREDHRGHGLDLADAEQIAPVDDAEGSR